MIQSNAVHAGLLGLLAGLAALAVGDPALAVVAAIAMGIAAYALSRRDDLAVARYGLYLVVILIPLASFGYIGAAPDSNAVLAEGAGVTVSKIIGFAALVYLLAVKTLYRQPWVRGWAAVGVVGLAAVLLVSHAVNPASPYAMTMLRRYLSAFIVFFLAANLIESERDLRRALACLVLGYLASAAMALTESGVGAAPAARLSGASGGSAVGFGLGLGVCAIAALHTALAGRLAWARKTAFAVALILLGAVVATYARSIYLGLAGALIALFVLLRRRRGVGALFGYILLGLAILAMTIDTGRFFSRIAEILASPAEDFSYARRLAYHTVGFSVWLRNPLVGVGPGAFSTYFENEEFRQLTDTFAGGLRSLHNTYLGVLCDAGLAGLAFLLTAFVAALREARFVIRSYDRGEGVFLRDAAEILLVALPFAMFGMAFNPMQTLKLPWLLVGLAVAAGAIRRRQLAVAGLPPAA